ncbi:branched-chain amino acid ABC transporter substrate-binding protein [Desulfomarina profundi]|uniref:Branched-chain amino acid ABC transporter substrate-binding protein n=1 Tax=Desulfomarina profundi TaxID=2772557 RepID=A0A8D5FQ48_9BACT|nr:amino acid ABC transporter substrate-binding protein [Desulfomarina profundi]BCL62354.1 branched-chain amino acid ABC transporter substrate-binding protein [Desulfomarina profundi]
MKIKVIFIFLLALCVGFSLIFLSMQQSAPTRSALHKTTANTEKEDIAPLAAGSADKSYILFGVSISRTGQFAVEGKNVIQGYNLWKKHVNENGGITVGDKKYTVKIKYYDDGSNIDRVRDNITRLIIDDKVDFILGPFSSAFNLAASKISERYGKIMIESGGASDSIFMRKQHFTFATQTSSSWWFKDFFDMIAQVNPSPETYALITPDKLFSRSVAKGVQIWAATKNIKKVYFRVVEKDTTDFIPYLREMADKHPDLIILTSHYRDAVNFSVQLSRIKELNPKAVVMTIGPSELDYINDVGEGAEGKIGVTQWVANSTFTGPVFGTPQDYAKKFISEYGEKPTYQDAQSSATGVIYQLALEKCNSLNALEVLNNVRNLDVETFYGRVKYNSSGMNIGHKMALVQIQQGKMKTIWPLEAAQSTIMYPLVPPQMENKKSEFN